MKQAEAATKQAGAPVISEVLSTELKPATKHGTSRAEAFPNRKLFRILLPGFDYL